MAEAISKLGGLTKGIKGFFVGIILGFVVSAVAGYLVSQLPAETQATLKSTPILTMNSWITVVAIPIVLVLLKRTTMAGGWFIGAAVNAAVVFK